MAGVPAGSGALVGTRLGNYELVALLALGGTAEIYLARIDGTAGFEKYVVVKCLHDHLAEDREFVQMFLDEARLGAQLDHSNIVQTLGLGEQDGRYYLVMEFIAGMSLALLARRAVERVPGGKIPVPLVLGIAAQACAGLHYAHEKQSSGKPLNLVHRDISPQNLVITFEGDVRIVDFGIAKAEERETATRSGTIKGKFAYMSPEQCHAKHIDRRTDVFALGVVVHELLTGRRLFKRGSTYETYQAILECKVPPPSSVNHELDPALDAVVMKALTKNANDRYPSAEAFGEAITRYLHSRGKFAGSSEISTFINQHFLPEIEDHGDRMRELLEGRAQAATGWDELDPNTIGASGDAEELSQFEIIGDAAPGQASAGSMAQAGDPDDLPVDATRIEMNPMALMESLDVPRSAPVPAAATPAPAAAAGKPRVPSFGSQGSASSIFGAVAPAPASVAPAPSSKPPPAATPVPGPSIFEAQTGSKLPPLRKPTVPGSTSARPGDRTLPELPRTGTPPARPGDRTLPELPRTEPPRARASTEPAPVGGRPFGPSNAAAMSTVIAEATPTPSSPRGFAAPPEARTMALNALMDDDPPPSPSTPAVAPFSQRGLPASFEAQIDSSPGRMIDRAELDREILARGATVPAMDAVSPVLRGDDAPTYRAPFVDPLRPVVSLTPLPMLSEPFTNDVPSPSGSFSSASPSGSFNANPPQPFPSGELLVPPHGTPPGTAPHASSDALPAHLVGLPPSNAYPRYDGSYPIPKLRRSVPGWVLPVAVSVIAAVVIGVVASLAT